MKVQVLLMKSSNGEQFFSCRCEPGLQYRSCKQHGLYAKNLVELL